MRRYILKVPRNEFETAKETLLQEKIKVLEEIKSVNGFLVEISREDLEKIKSRHPQWQFLSPPTRKDMKTVVLRPKSREEQDYKPIRR